MWACAVVGALALAALYEWVRRLPEVPITEEEAAEFAQSWREMHERKGKK